MSSSSSFQQQNGPASAQLSGVVTPVVCYTKCMRNHALAVGKHAVDGCGEFMASSPDPTAALTCAACGCHRSYHLREIIYEFSVLPPPPAVIDGQSPMNSAKTEN
ncbi:hypothetical protein BRADI_4g26170v3 [Brachypodium distachyon]|uniref:ZF-HD dimerization-type domain-containing protein n=1 Tax=Brachypodium distachyon TaxID=15368 RepID=I1INP4_BRADI|nr:hypothetical protein BRADI_4g26170v3 [Brachypodium distachyon]